MIFELVDFRIIRIEVVGAGDSARIDGQGLRPPTIEPIGSSEIYIAKYCELLVRNLEESTAN